jgi:hypothetical protein
MRNSMLQLGSFALILSAPIAVPTAAPAAPAFDVVAFCKDAVGPNPQPQNMGTIGECVSLFLTENNPNGFPAHICDLLNERGLLDEVGYVSFSDCVRGEHSLR